MATLIDKVVGRPVDVMGYSMGGGVALRLAAAHPALVERLVVMSAPYCREGWYAEVREPLTSVTPEMLSGTSIETAYCELASDPRDFDGFVRRVAELSVDDVDLTPEEVRGLKAPTMIILGDADVLSPTHACEMFMFRGGGDRKAAAMGFGLGVPKAQLMILPMTTHIGLVAEVEIIVEFARRFLNVAPYATPFAAMT